MPGRFSTVFEIKGLRNFVSPFPWRMKTRRKSAAATPKSYPQNPKWPRPRMGAGATSGFVDNFFAGCSDEALEGDCNADHQQRDQRHPAIEPPPVPHK